MRSVILVTEEGSDTCHIKNRRAISLCGYKVYPSIEAWSGDSESFIDVVETYEICQDCLTRYNQVS